MKTKFIDFLFEAQKINYIDTSIYDYFLPTENLEEPYKTYKRNNNIEDISFDTWELSQFPKYEEKIKTLLNGHYNENKYLSHDEMSDLTFIYHQFRKYNYAGGEYYTNRDNEALVAFLVYYNRLIPKVSLAKEKYDDMYSNIKTLDDYETRFRTENQILKDTDKVINRVKFE